MESDAEGQQELLLKQSHVARWVEPQLLATLSVESVGWVVFSPLGKDVLT